MQVRTITVELYRDGPMCFIPVPFDPKAAFGRIRAPVKVTVNGYTYRSTISAMGAINAIPLRKSNREAAGLEGGETILVKIELDTETREVELQEDFAGILRANTVAWSRWQKLSYTYKREHVEAIMNAKKAETRERRIASTLRFLEAE